MDKSALGRWRSMPAEDVLLAIADHAKPDPSYKPVKAAESRRWHASFGGRDFELLTTGAKFWDTRSRAGGGGAVDLVMHLADMDFRAAVRYLEKRGI